MNGAGAQPVQVHQTVAEPAGPRLTTAASMLLELAPLDRLEALTLSNVHEPPHTLEFTVLPQLPVLAHFSLTMAPHPRAPRGSPSASLFHATPAQVQCLSQCKMLTSLRCGTWSKPWYETPAVRADPRTQALLSHGIGQLVRGKIAALTESHATVTAQRQLIRSSREDAPQPTAAPLQTIPLDGTMIYSSLWRYLSSMRSLTHLTPLAWYNDLAAADWARLANFKHLRAFALTPVAEDSHEGGPGPIRAEQFLPALLQCTHLQSLHLSSVDLSKAQLHAICTRLPSLKHLSFRTLNLESVEPLALAPKLQQLSLHFCTQRLVPPPQDTTAPAAPSTARTPNAAAASRDGSDGAPAAGEAAPMQVEASESPSSAMSEASSNGAASPAAAAPAPAAAAAAADTVAPSSTSDATQNTPSCFRRTLPSLPALRQLMLHDRVRLSAAAAAPLNAALLQRLPLLRMKHFHQNLLAEISVNIDTA